MFVVCYCFIAFLLLILGFFRVYHPPSDPAHDVCPAVARSHATTAGGDNVSSSESSHRGRGAVQQETGHCSQRNTPAREPAQAGAHTGETGLPPGRNACLPRQE